MNKSLPLLLLGLGYHKHDRNQRSFPATRCRLTRGIVVGRVLDDCTSKQTGGRGLHRDLTPYTCTLQPNKRLLAGGDRLKGKRSVVPWRARTVVRRPCARGRVARSLRAIRCPARISAL